MECAPETLALVLETVCMPSLMRTPNAVFFFFALFIYLRLSFLSFFSLSLALLLCLSPFSFSVPLRPLSHPRPAFASSLVVFSSMLPVEELVEGVPRPALFLCSGLVLGIFVTLCSFCIFGRCILQRSQGDALVDTKLRRA